MNRTVTYSAAGVRPDIRRAVLLLQGAERQLGEKQQLRGWRRFLRFFQFGQQRAEGAQVREAARVPGDGHLIAGAHDSVGPAGAQGAFGQLLHYGRQWIHARRLAKGGRPNKEGQP